MWKPHTRVTTKICWTCIIRAFRIEFMCIFSVGKLFCTCGAGDDASYVRFGETKYKYFNRSLRHGTEMRHRNLRSDSVPNRFHRYRCHVGTGFRYATLTVRERDERDRHHYKPETLTARDCLALLLMSPMRRGRGGCCWLLWWLKWISK